MSAQLPEFAVRLRSLREAARLSQDEVARGARLSRTSVTQYESGVRKPKFEALCRLAAVLRCSPVEINPYIAYEGRHMGHLQPLAESAGRYLTRPHPCDNPNVPGELKALCAGWPDLPDAVKDILLSAFRGALKKHGTAADCRPAKAGA